jgi:hypothetical protein
MNRLLKRISIVFVLVAGLSLVATAAPGKRNVEKFEFSLEEIRCGVSDMADLSVTLTLTTNRPEIAQQVEIRCSNTERAWVEVTEIKGTTLTLKVVGKTGTIAKAPEGDASIEAVLNGNVRASIPVLVIVPTYRIHTVQKETHFNTVKPFEGQPGKVQFASTIRRLMKIEILDQFKQPLDSMYNGKGFVSEHFTDINNVKGQIKITLAQDAIDGDMPISLPDGKLTDGVIYDQVGRTLSPNIPVDEKSPGCKAWLAEKPVNFQGKVIRNIFPLVGETYSHFLIDNKCHGHSLEVIEDGKPTGTNLVRRHFRILAKDLPASQLDLRDVAEYEDNPNRGFDY